MLSRKTKHLLALSLCTALAANSYAEEKVLNLYSARHYQTDDALYSGFTKQTGIKINRIDGKEDELLERIKNEGANSPADVLITVDAARLADVQQGGANFRRIAGEGRQFAEHSAEAPGIEIL